MFSRVSVIVISNISSHSGARPLTVPKIMAMPVDTFVEMGAAIIPAIHSLTTFCLFNVAPFNIIKGIVVSLITLVLYKHISRLLKGSQA